MAMAYATTPPIILLLRVRRQRPQRWPRQLVKISSTELIPRFAMCKRGGGIHT